MFFYLERGGISFRISKYVYQFLYNLVSLGVNSFLAACGRALFVPGVNSKSAYILDHALTQ